MTHLAHYITQPEIDAMTERTQEVAKAAIALNPHVPWLRTSAETKLDIARLTAEAKDNVEGFEGILPRFKRQLSEHIARRDSLKESLKRTEQTIADLKKAGADHRNPRLAELLGFDFYSKTYQCVQHRTGVLDQIREQLGSVELRIESLEAAVKNTQKRVDRELPVLQAELQAALKAEALLR